MSKYQIFQPGEYLDFEKEHVQFRMDVFNGKAAPPPMPFGPPEPRPYTEAEIIEYNRTWNPYDPLYNDPEYARAHGHPGVPAYPGFNTMPPIMSVPGFPKNIASQFYYTNDGTDIRYSRNVYPGDLLEQKTTKVIFDDITKPGDDIRGWFMGGEGEAYDQSGKLVYQVSGNVRDMYRKIIDGSPAPSFTEHMTSWTKDFPPAHVTTDEDYQRIKAIWDAEVMNGDNTPFWEDIDIGFELPKTCSDGPVTYMHMMYWYNIGGMSIYSREELFNPQMRETTFRDRFGAFLDETALHFTSRNIPGFRGVWYNDTGARLIARTLTNFVGNKGRVSRFSWRFYPFFPELRKPLCVEEFKKVPGMEGRDCDRHGSEGDTCIGRAVVTGKYVNSAGEHCLEVMLWAEDLEGNIVQGCPSEIVLPSKND